RQKQCVGTWPTPSSKLAHLQAPDNMGLAARGAVDGRLQVDGRGGLRKRAIAQRIRRRRLDPVAITTPNASSASDPDGWPCPTSQAQPPSTPLDMPLPP